MKTWRAQLAGAVLIVVMAVSLGIEASHLPRKATTSSLPSLTPIAHRTCAQAEAVGDNVGTTQRNDGSFSACLRVGSVAPGSYQITARSFSKTPTVGTVNPPGSSITVTPRSGPPGTVVTVSAYVPGTSPDSRWAQETDLCWADCDALAGSSEIDWSSSTPGEFTLHFTVPAAPWFTGTRVSPLRPGRYAVIVPCATTFENPRGLCTGVSLETQFELTGGGSGLCQTAANCAVLESSPREGTPGTLLAVNGWAPLIGLNGGGFLQMAIESHPPQSKLGSPSPKPIASMPFTVIPAPGWASLPAIHPISLQRTGMDAIGVDPGNPRRFAYCGSGAIKITTNAGSSWSTISLAGVRAASGATNYPIPGSFTAGLLTCASVVLDARYPGTIYAVFEAVPRNSAPPPFYFVAYLSRNSGRSWQPVPVPAQSEMGLFGGFRAYATGTAALFWSQPARNAGGPASFLVQQTVDGGRTWQAANLRCPSRGPCIALGAQDNARCMAIGEYQAIEKSVAVGRSGTSPRWAGRMDSCVSSRPMMFVIVR